MPEIVWIPLLCYSLAFLALVEVFAIRAGHLRKWPERYYFASGSKQFAGIGPFAAFFALMATAVLATELPGRWVLLSLACVAAAFASAGLGLYWMRRPPDFVKPPWLRDAEQRQRKGRRWNTGAFTGAHAGQRRCFSCK